MPAEAGTHDTGLRWAEISGVAAVRPLRGQGRELWRASARGCVHGSPAFGGRGCTATPTGDDVPGRAGRGGRYRTRDADAAHVVVSAAPKKRRPPGRTRGPSWTRD